MNKKENIEKDLGGATLNKQGEIIRIPAKTDFMFKNLFGVNGREENLKWLLEAILKIEIKSLEIQNPELPREYKEDKLGILDVRAKLEDGTIASIEMQVRNENNMGERIVFYASKLYTSGIQKGEEYEEINKTIVIGITNFSYFRRREYHQIAHVKFEECKDEEEIVDKKIEEGKESQIVTDKLEIHIIDLKKFEEKKGAKGDLADWLNLIIGNEGAIEMAKKRNEKIAKADEENKRLSNDEKMQAMYLSRQMAIYDENTRIRSATRKGIKEGMEKGIEKGERNKQIEIAKKLLAKNVKIEEIMELTELTKEEIEKIK